MQLSDRALSTSTSFFVTPSSLDHTSLLTLYFLEETGEYGTFVKIADMIDGTIPREEYNDEMLVVNMSQITDDVQPKIVSPLNLFRVLAIEMVEDVQFVCVPSLLTLVPHDDDVFVCVISSIMVESEHVEPPLSFDILLRFVSHSDDVLTFSSYMHMSLF